MSHPLFSDKRTSSLLSRVSEDLQQLRHDVGSLLGHTTKHTLPEGARELADTARSRINAGTNYAASQLRSLRSTRVDPTTGIIAGAALIGLLGLGIYALTKHRCCSDDSEIDPEEVEEAEA